MTAAEKDEEKVDGYFGKIKKRIKAAGKKKGNFLVDIIFGGAAVKFLFTVVGGLILITLTRVAAKKWYDAYVPKTDAKGGTILGVKIPGLE